MITNCWGKVPVKRIAVEDGFVYQGRPGTAYNHQSQLTTHQGALVATWTLGVRDEEGPGEDMVFAVSEDLGKSWSPPKVVVGSQPGRAARTDGMGIRICMWRVSLDSSSIRTTRRILVSSGSGWMS